MVMCVTLRVGSKPRTSVVTDIASQIVSAPASLDTTIGVIEPDASSRGVRVRLRGRERVGFIGRAGSTVLHHP